PGGPIDAARRVDPGGAGVDRFGIEVGRVAAGRAEAGRLIPGSGFHEPQVAGGEVAQVGQDVVELDVAHAEPAGEGGGVLIDSGHRQQPAVADVVLGVAADHRKATVDIA